VADGTLEYQLKVDIPTGPIDAGDKKLKELEATLRKLQQPGKIKALEDQIKNFGKHGEHGFKGIGHSIDEAKEKWNHFAEFVGAALVFEGLEKVTEKVIELGEEIIHAAAAAERMDLSFDLSMGEEAGRETVEYLERITGKTEFADEQLKGWAKSLVNAGVAAEDLDKNMAAAMDVAAKSPNKLEGMERAIQALTRANLSGAVDMRQLRGLSIGVEQLKTLPKFANLSVKQLKKEMEKGKLTKDDLLAVIAGPDKILGDLGLKAGKTMEARLLHLKSIPEEIFQKLAKTAAWEKLGGVIDRVLEKLDPEGPTGKRIGKAIEDAVSKVSDLIDGIDIEGAIEGIISVFEALEDVAGPVLHAITAELEGWGYIMATIRGHGDEFVDKFAKAQQVRKERERAADVRRTQKEAEESGDFDLLDKAAASGALGERSKRYHEAAEKAGATTGQGFAAGVQKSRGQARDKTAEMGEDAVGAMRKKLDAHSPSVVFEDLGAMAAAGFAMGVRGGARAVDDAVDGMMRAPAVAPRAAGAGGGISLTIERVEINSIGSNGEDAYRVGGELARGFTDQLRPLLTSLAEEVAAELGAGGV